MVNFDYEKQLLAYRLNHTGRNCSSICINECLLSKEYGENRWETTLSNSCQFFSYYFSSNRQLYYPNIYYILRYVSHNSWIHSLLFFSGHTILLFNHVLFPQTSKVARHLYLSDRQQNYTYFKTGFIFKPQKTSYSINHILFLISFLSKIMIFTFVWSLAQKYPIFPCASFFFTINIIFYTLSIEFMLLEFTHYSFINDDHPRYLTRWSKSWMCWRWFLN